MPWLLASDATSTPAAFRAVSAEGGARKVYCLPGAGVPPVVIAVSRLTMAMSARLSTLAMGPSAVLGLASRRVRSTPSKWTSPPNAMVYGRRFGFGLVVGETLAAGSTPSRPEAPGSGAADPAAEQAAASRAETAVSAIGARRRR